MKKNSLFYNSESNMIYRVLNSKNDKAFVINCTTRHMPFWTELSSILNLNPITEDELLNITNTELEELKMSSKEYKYAQEHFSLIVNILPVIENKNERNKMIQYVSESKNCSKQTVRKILCTYLIFQNIAALAPKKSIEKKLSSDEKNMRWALNKFFYTKNKNTLSTAYMMMLKEKYNADNEGHIFLAIKNASNETMFIDENEKIVQAVFVKFGIADEEEVTTERTGGIGSTGK